MKTVIVLLVALAAGACGDSGGAFCAKAGRLLCERACECGQTACVIAVGSAGGTATISFDTEPQCTALYVDLGCAEGGNPEIDHQACYEALQAAQCAGSSPTDGILLPDVCNASQ